MEKLEGLGESVGKKGWERVLGRRGGRKCWEEGVGKFVKLLDKWNKNKISNL